MRAGAVAAQVVAGGIAREHQTFVPYDYCRWAFGQLEGTLGLDFFAPFSVAADWHHERYYLTPRTPGPEATALRLTRWGTQLPASCAATGCVSIEIAQGVERAPAELGMADDHPPPLEPAMARITRDPAARGLPLEVVFAATSPSGEAYPSLYIHLPAGVDTITARVQPRYAAAQLAPADVSPFPRACGGCVVMGEP